MKWKAKFTRIDYPNFSTRTKTVFAWTPTYISGSFVWLENYEILQVFVITEYNLEIEGEKVYITKSDWTDLSKRAI